MISNGNTMKQLSWMSYENLKELLSLDQTNLIYEKPSKSVSQCGVGWVTSPL